MTLDPETTFAAQTTSTVPVVSGQVWAYHSMAGEKDFYACGLILQAEAEARGGSKILWFVHHGDPPRIRQVYNGSLGLLYGGYKLVMDHEGNQR